MTNAKSKVLIVEDESAIAEALSFLMSREGLEPFVARDGDLALKATQTAKLDLIILDLMLPRVSGTDLLRLIRAQALNQDTPILVLTARGQENDADRVMALGATAFMTKPFANAALVAQAQALLAASQSPT